MPNTIGAIVISDSRMLGTSTGPGAGSFDSRTSSGVSTSSGMRTGTASRNTEPHQKCSMSRPPTIGPSADPAAKPDAQIAIATRRWSRSWNTLRSSDSVEGMSIAPKKPRTALAAISSSAVGANAAAAETAANPVAPISSTVRRPIRSPRLPIATSRPARTSGYTSTIHSIPVADGCSASEIAGSAKLSTVLSRETSSTGSIRTTRAAQPRAPARTGAVTGARFWTVEDMPLLYRLDGTVGKAPKPPTAGG